MGSLLNSHTEKQILAAMPTPGLTSAEKRRLEIALRLNNGESASAVARLYGMSRMNVSLIRRDFADSATVEAYLSRIVAKALRIIPDAVKASVLVQIDRDINTPREIAERHNLPVPQCATSLGKTALSCRGVSLESTSSRRASCPSENQWSISLHCM